MKEWKPVLWVLAVLVPITVASAVVMMVVFVRSTASGPGTDARPFSSAMWKAADDYEPNPRYEMVDDLVDRVGLVGRTREEVVALLGPADAGSFTWRLGPGRTIFETDPVYLHVHLGSDGRVSRVGRP